MSLRLWLKSRRSIVHRWVPQGVRDLLNRWLGYAIYYRGEYADWAEARGQSDGYAEEALLLRLTKVAEAVKTGQAAWEQDGVTWGHIPADMPLFAALARVALSQEGRLSVLDFGGGLGSSYFQCREFLADATELTWAIVEQPELVTIGQRGIERDALHFHASMDEAIAAHRPNVVLLSSVLQYLESPWVILDQIIASEIPYLIIDRHPCTLTRETITVQVVPASLYAASYPSWLFDCPRMLAVLARHFELLAEWPGKDPAIRGWGMGAEFHGYFLKRREDK